MGQRGEILREIAEEHFGTHPGKDNFRHTCRHSPGKETGFCHVGLKLTGLELLTSSDLPTLASQSVGIADQAATALCHLETRATDGVCPTQGSSRHCIPLTPRPSQHCTMISNMVVNISQLNRSKSLSPGNKLLRSHYMFPIQVATVLQPQLLGAKAPWSSHASQSLN
ncbi:hypothetical protein AAY473_032009 [Plecturocebus cupreus]